MRYHFLQIALCLIWLKIFFLLLYANFFHQSPYQDFANTLLCFPGCLYAENNPQPKSRHQLTDDPIDVVIVSHPKDQETLDACIEGIIENCCKVRRVIVISATRLTDKAEWFNENRFPFTKKDVAKAIARGDLHKSEKLLRNHHRGAGWFFQQLLKLYAPFVVPDISSNVLVIDADTVFMNRVAFLNELLGGLFCVSNQVANQVYLRHAERLVPGYRRVYPEFFSVCHHMLFQKQILKSLFKSVENAHHTSFWVAFCTCVDLKEKGASEYEIYYNYALTHADQVAVRELKWTNSAHFDELDHFKRDGYHFVSFHTYMRGKWPRTYPVP
jgi:Family of unknown function (DUF6492)